VSTAALTDVVAAVQGLVPYLRCEPSAPAAEGWLACDSLLADPLELRRQIDATAPGRGTSDEQVAASLFAQAYAFRVSSIAVAAFALDLPVPSTAPEGTAVRIARHRPSDLAVTDSVCRSLTPSDLAAELLDGHLGPFIVAVRTTTRVGERLLWGNVAASIATVLRAIHGASAKDAPRVRQRAQELFEAMPQLAELGAWSSLTAGDSAGWYWDRTSCCLWYQTTGGSYCDDCSLLDPGERTAARLAELAGTAS
jgi:ferric iron reductase protein FhuF